MAGLRTVAAAPTLRALAGIEGLLAFGMALTGTSLMIFVSRDLGLGTGELGLVFALGGLGAVLGGSLAPRLGRRLGPGRTMALGLALMAAGAACVPLAGVAGGAGLAALAWLATQQIVGDAGHTTHDVHDLTLRQTAVPMALLARADGGIRSIGQGATLAGAPAGGVLGHFAGTLAALWLAAAMALQHRYWRPGQRHGSCRTWQAPRDGAAGPANRTPHHGPRALHATAVARQVSPPGAGAAVSIHHAPSIDQRARANQRRRAGGAQAQDRLV